jgi:hypothetical protein
LSIVQGPGFFAISHLFARARGWEEGKAEGRRLTVTYKLKREERQRRKEKKEFEEWGRFICSSVLVLV